MKKFIGLLLFSLSAMAYCADDKMVSEHKPVHYTFTVEEDNIVVNTFTGISNQITSDLILDRLDNIPQCNNEIPKMHTICANEEVPQQLKLYISIIPTDHNKYIITFNGSYNIGVLDQNNNIVINEIKSSGIVDKNNQPSSLKFPVINHYILSSRYAAVLNEEAVLADNKGFTMIDERHGFTQQKSFKLKIKITD